MFLTLRLIKIKKYNYNICVVKNHPKKKVLEKLGSYDKYNKKLAISPFRLVF